MNDDDLLKCERCGSTEETRMVKPRKSWGAAGQSYWLAERWCRMCCIAANGQYKLCDGQPRLKPRKPVIN